ncbi:ABC transporter ATP-binding protein [Geobacter benzoatilyticus]|uniref:ABC transporter ATP-binding protein n=1 Tax=Geobacter benzoatilyticus TaxID=2815309 RepID=A0ABX7Q7B1_9BACT|nr:ABC transporter ATP-binding protein [Geobacter benzoatilyticus]QSV46860.1 ABC transporter ATP-binding protein [Geobacter benzoatilyticus]
MRRCRRTYILGAVCLLGTNAFALLVPWLLKLAVESLRNPSAASRSATWYGGAIIGAALIHGVIRIFSRTTLLHAARRIEYAIREDLYVKLLSLDMPYFEGGRTGDLMSRFANDLTNIRMLLGFGVLNIINTALIYVSAIALMARINPSLTLWAVVPFPLMIIAAKGITRRMFHHSRRAQEELAHLTSQAEESIAAAVVVRSYCREDATVAAFEEIGRRYLRRNMTMARLRGFLLPIMAATSALGTLIVLFLGGQRVIGGAMTLGDFVAFNGYLAMLVWPTIIFGWILNLIQRGAASMARLNEVFDAVPRVTEPEEPAGAWPLRGEIELRDVRFSYGTAGVASPPVLDGVSLTVSAGSSLGIVGAVGSGKSTLVRLLARLYPIPDGRIFLDGTDVNRMPLSRLRSAIGFVPQESFLFSRTVRENIAYGKEGATSEEIEAAARLASLDGDVLRFADGYETVVGERGVTLSGGQKQRTAIARALLKNPAVLILDDPLSAVDAQTEDAILESLSGYWGDRTVVIVSHRLSAVRECDRIIVLKDGVIAEQGSHDDLLARNGLYGAMWREQQIQREIASL